MKPPKDKAKDKDKKAVSDYLEAAGMSHQDAQAAAKADDKDATYEDVALSVRDACKQLRKAV